jgi:DNA-directed RNA polymerase subunit alpha
MSNTIDLSGLVRPQLVEATTRDDQPMMAEFRLQPLERGFGHTLGNAMRRLLLSSLRGSAVWAFRIDGVVHEHQTIAGVIEDVHQIIANLKSLTLALPDEVESTVLRLKKVGPGAVTAADIQATGGVRVVDAAHHLFTISDERELSVELYVNKGRGYVEAEQHPVDRQLPVDTVRIDAIYSPVRRANFTVGETRVGQRTDYDRLTLSVETNGTISPRRRSRTRPRWRRRTSSTSWASARPRRFPSARPMPPPTATPCGWPSCSVPRSTTWSCPSDRSIRSRTRTSVRSVTWFARPKRRSSR